MLKSCEESFFDSGHVKYMLVSGANHLFSGFETERLVTADPLVPNS